MYTITLNSSLIYSCCTVLCSCHIDIINLHIINRLVTCVYLLFQLIRRRSSALWPSTSGRSATTSSSISTCSHRCSRRSPETSSRTRTATTTTGRAISRRVRTRSSSALCCTRVCAPPSCSSLWWWRRATASSSRSPPSRSRRSARRSRTRAARPHCTSTTTRSPAHRRTSLSSTWAKGLLFSVTWIVLQKFDCTSSSILYCDTFTRTVNAFYLLYTLLYFRFEEAFKDAHAAIRAAAAVLLLKSDGRSRLPSDLKVANYFDIVCRYFDCYSYILHFCLSHVRAHYIFVYAYFVQYMDSTVRIYFVF